MEMKARTLEKLQYYLGKVITIITTTINRNFDEIRAREHFVVTVQEINHDGIWGSHPYNRTLSFFLWEHIVSLHEEIVLDPKNPDHKKMIEEYENKTGKKVISDVSPHLAPSTQSSAPIQPKANEEDKKVTFVDIKSLSQLAMQTKRNYDAADKSRQ